MKQPKTIWIDLTDLSEWNGHLTGVQRLVYQIAKRYSVHPNVNYFIFKQRSKTFHEFDFGIVEKQINSKPEHASAQAADAKLDQVKAIGYKVYAKSPLWLKDRLASPQNKDRMRRVYHGVRRRIRRPSLNLGKKISSPTANFGSGDLVLVMGKAWDYSPDFMEAMRIHKVKTGFKLVQVVYDLIPVFYPHLFGIPLIAPYTKHMFEVAANSDGLLAISNNTKKDMQKFCKQQLVTEPKIEVIRLGDDFSEVGAKKPKIKGLEKDNFILCVGTVEIRKNHQLLYTTYKEALAQGKKMPKLVIVGGRGWYTEDVMYQFIFDPEIKDLVYIEQKITDQGLRWLYENCLFTVYPSVYEGWGLPVAESLMYGKVCISSNAASMPEIAGNLIDYFSPYNSQQCLDAISKYLNADERKRKEAEIAAKYKPTSWDDTYKQINSLIESTLE